MYLFVLHIINLRILFYFLQVIQFFIRENGPELAADQDIIKAGSFDPKLLPRSRTRKKKEKKKKKSKFKLLTIISWWTHHQSLPKVKRVPGPPSRAWPNVKISHAVCPLSRELRSGQVMTNVCILKSFQNLLCHLNDTKFSPLKTIYARKSYLLIPS